MALELTDQQEAIIDQIVNGTDNVCGVARAGSAKTTTGKLAFNKAAEANPSLEQGGAAFNRVIAAALGEAIPQAMVKTTNGFGHGAWMRRISCQVKSPDTRKNFKILNELRLRVEEFPDAAKAIALCKAWGIVPSGALAEPTGLYLDEPQTYHNLFTKYNVDCGTHPDPIGIVRAALLRTIEMGWQGHIDFDDQLYLSTIYKCSFQKFDMLLLDEAQDLIPTQREMARLMLKPEGRLIAFGDDRQAIYGFRGADRQSLSMVIKEFNCSKMPLTISFRCPQRVVLAAQRLVPDIEPWPEAPQGVVERLEKITVEEIQENKKGEAVAILCRNNAPLIAACLRFIKRSIGATILGRDIGRSLASLIKKTRAQTVGDLNQRIWNEIEKQKALLSAKTYDTSAAEAILDDKGECIAVLMQAHDLDDSINVLLTAIDQMFTDKGAGITLSTIHKAKGMEWPQVYILDTHLMPSKWAKTPDEQLQEANLEYVAITRSQRALYYINSEGLR